MVNIWDPARIQQARLDAAIPAKEATTRLKITRPYLSMLENGQKQPSNKLMARISHTYGRPVAYFLQTDAEIEKQLTNS